MAEKAREALVDVEALLPKLNWQSMHHCRGEAGDVPRLLREATQPLRSPERERARQRLRDALCYQGSIFEPTLHATPVFLAALESADTDLQRWALGWMSVLANAYTMTEGQGTLEWISEDRPERRDAEAQFEREKSWVTRVHTHVWRAVPRLLDLVREGGAEENTVAAPCVLLDILRHARDSAPDGDVVARSAALLGDIERQRLQSEDDDRLRACHAGALGRLLGDHGYDAEAALVAEAWPMAYPLTASVAARDLAFLQRGNTELLARTLGSSLCRIDEHSTWLPRAARMPWITGHLRFSLTRVLCLLPDEAFDAQLEVIAATLRDHTNSFVYDALAAPVVARVLGDFVVDESTRRHHLPHRAVAVLDALLASRLWDDPRIANPVLAMRTHGLEYKHDFWARMLGT